MEKFFKPITIFVFILLNVILAAAIFCGFHLFENSRTLKKHKINYFTVNQIKYGLLDAQNWTDQVNTIIVKEINNFELTTENEAILKEELNRVLAKLLDEVDEVLHKKQETAKDKIKYKVFNSLVDINDFKKDIPRFSHRIICEIKKSKNKEKVKEMVSEKVTDVLTAVSDSLLNAKQVVLKKYAARDVTTFNKKINFYNRYIEEEQTRYGYALISLMVFMLFFWILLLKLKPLHTIAFVYSVLLSFVTLFIGINLPMIEIDARIGELDVNLLSSKIIFTDQVIFYQSKSILDVVVILFKAGKLDAIFVAVLIFIFSVVFPISKLICSILFLIFKEKSNGLIQYMAFKSGKWSMADVMVVAIFMAYVGFQGILNSQFEKLQLSHEKVNLLTTNRSNLQIGFLIFVSFVLCNLILSEVLKKITKKNSADFKMINIKLLRLKIGRKRKEQ